MSTYKLMSKRTILNITAVILVMVTVLSIVLLNGGTSVSAENIKVDNDSATIYVGTHIKNFTIDPAAQKNPELLKGADKSKYLKIDDKVEAEYIAERKAFLSKLSKTQGDKVFSSVVLLDDYYSVQQVKALADSENLTIERVYLWIPGQTGRLSIAVENNDIDKALSDHFKKFKEKDIPDDQMKADYERLMAGDFGIFSITVKATANTFNALQNKNDMIDFIDVKYNPDAESIAKESGKRIQYVELPSKPDGAL